MRVVTRVVASRGADRLAADDAFQTLDGKWPPAEIILEDGLVKHLPAGKVEKRLAVSPSARENMPASVQYSVMGQRMALRSLVTVSTVTVAGMFATLKGSRGRVDDAMAGPGLSCGDRVNRTGGALSDTQYALVAATGASTVAGNSVRRAATVPKRAASAPSHIGVKPLKYKIYGNRPMHQGDPK